MTVPVSVIVSAIDRYGADLATWPERDLAKAARLAVLSDPDVRAWLDDARHLEGELDRVRASVDEEIARSGAPERVGAAVRAAAAQSTALHPRWAAIAATLVIAAGLGAAVELTTGVAAGDQSFDVVVMDPLVFGPTGFDQP
jgi:hypothetical protein